MRVLLPFNSSFFRNNCIGLEIYSCIVVEVDSSQILNGGENMLQKEICQWSKIRQSIENFKFHSCKADPRWYGARTSNPWENKRSAVRFRLLYVYCHFKSIDSFESSSYNYVVIIVVL